jgi:hypothetical protein
VDTQLIDECTIKVLRSHIPIEGSDWTYLWKLEVMPGASVFEHTHQGWTACVHHVDEREKVKVHLILDGKAVWPEKDEVVLIPPGIKHSVPPWRGEYSRHTFALTMNPGDNRQVVKTVVRTCTG